MSIKDFATHIEKDDVRLVTVNRQFYWVYRYEGALNDLDNAVVLITWHEDALFNPKAMRCFLSTDTELDTQKTLEYYSKSFSARRKGTLVLISIKYAILQRLNDFGPLPF